MEGGRRWCEVGRRERERERADVLVFVFCSWLLCLGLERAGTVQKIKAKLGGSGKSS